MSTDNMPVAEAAHGEAEANHYEFAFHVLPTVTEGEVPAVFEAIKNHITNAGGTIITEEAPQRVELAYEIVKPIDGKNRKFGSAYFGWVRFALLAEQLADLSEELDTQAELLRTLTIKLSRHEEEAPFFYHEALVSQSKVRTISDDVAADTKETDDADESDKTDEDKDENDEENGTVEESNEESGEVSEKELDDSLEKITK